MKTKLLYWLSICFICCVPHLQADVRFVPSFTPLTFKKPVLLVSANDHTGRLFVVEQGGKIQLFNPEEKPLTSSTFFDISHASDNRFLDGGEQGLLGLTFDPAYQQNGYFYVNYTASKPRRSVISRFSVDPNNPNKTLNNSEKILLEVSQDYPNHNGGMISFGPDGYLYVGMGDGGSAGDPKNRAQDGNSLLGKMLRINSKGKAPADNPFTTDPNIGDEIWALGLRNPWRFSFDRQTGQLWLADVGQNQLEEINLIEKGGNYGWRWFEGSQIFSKETPPENSSFIRPIFEYGRADGRSVTGGFVYRGNQYPTLNGKYFFGDFVSGKMWALNSESKTAIVLGTLPNPSGFGEDEQGELYVLSYSGVIYQITAH